MKKLELSLSAKERIEVDYWRSSSASISDLQSLGSLTNTLNKLTDAGVFLNALLGFTNAFNQVDSILEIGAGQGWASCVVKRLYPEASVAASDISPWALASLRLWEHIFQVRLDYVFCSKSYAIALKDSSVQCVFCFSSAHHFCAQRRTLADIYRILKPGGQCVYFFEPSCPRFWHRLAVWRVNRKRPEVPEDVLVYRKMQQVARQVGFECRISFDTSLYKRAPFETLYYGALRAIPLLARMLPCTVTYHFVKPR
jgi:ubiquinone/menaquinone biosynthesis C-methylase UbiE